LLQLKAGQPIFVGFKLDTSLRRQIEAISSSDRKYVSADDSSFLRLCQLGEDVYLGKLIDERLTTDRVDDVRRNVLSIVRRLCPEVRLPEVLEILPCGTELAPPAEPGHGPKERAW
jgi:hypothetical protein